MMYRYTDLRMWTTARRIIYDSCWLQKIIYAIYLIYPPILQGSLYLVVLAHNGESALGIKIEILGECDMGEGEREKCG